MIYFDNAATSQKKPECVIDAVIFAMKNMGNASRGTNSASLDASRCLYDTRKKLADLFNVKDCNNIAFTYNSTEALNMAIKGIAKKGCHIISTILEHNSVLRPLYELEKLPCEISFVGADESGNPIYSDFENLIKKETIAIVCTHISNLTGNVVNIEKIGRLCKKHNILFIVDASQSAGVFDIDVEKMNIDILCFTGHKSLLGPQGVGGIYVSPKVDIKVYKSGGTGVNTFDKEQPNYMPTKLEAGTLNIHGIAGLNASLSYISDYGIENIRKKENDNMLYFYENIKDIAKVKIYGDFSNKERGAIVSINIGDISSAEVADILLNDYGINIRSGGHCAPLMHKHFQTQIQGMVRFSFSHFNTKQEIATAISSIKDIAYSYYK